MPSNSRASTIFIDSYLSKCVLFTAGELRDSREKIGEEWGDIACLLDRPAAEVIA